MQLMFLGKTLEQERKIGSFKQLTKLEWESVLILGKYALDYLEVIL